MDVEKGTDEEIEEVYAYKVPLHKWVPAIWPCYHMYVVYKTKNWCWSIEKHCDRVNIQRKSTLSAVRDRLHDEPRIGTPVRMYADKASDNIKMKELLFVIKNVDAYDPVLSNCQHFAAKVFNRISKNVKIWQ